MSHPSELRLEAHLLDPSAEIAAHVVGCERCAHRLEEMAQEGDRFRREVYPRTVVAVRDAAERARRPWWRARWLVPAVSLATVSAAVLLVLRPGVPSDDYIGIKGGLGLRVYAEAPGGSQLLADGARVPAAAALRFSLRVPARCHPWIASVDAAGTVSQLYPPPGTASPELERSGPLPGGALLDGKPGPERVYAVCPAMPISWEMVRGAVARAAGNGESAVRNAGPLPGLPKDVPQSTLLLEKIR